MAPPTKYKEEYCDLLVGHMKEGFSFESFGAKVDVHKDTLYQWEKRYDSFADAKKRGTLHSMLFWEELGIKGTKGQVPFFNVGSWIFNMKNRFKWTDSVQVDLEDAKPIVLAYKL